jgi:hypothetical protein
MKTLKNILFIAALFMVVNVSAQTDKATTIKLVEGKNFIFNATSAQPMNFVEINAVLSRMPGSVGAGVVPLRGDIYQVTVANDSLGAYLPYYGRSYMAPRNPIEGGIKFSTTEFSYKADKKKKGNYIVTIKPVSSKLDVLSMTLNISEKGYASLSVISNNRQSITYSGYISDPAKLAAN